jgi:hypothetical protein
MLNGYPGFIDRLRKATLNVDIDTAKLLVEAANVIEDISSNWEPKSRRVAETARDLDDLPSGAVVRDRHEYVYEKRIWGLHTTWLEMGNELSTYASSIELPAQILWVPEEEA